MSEEKKWVLWENPEMSLQAAYNPAIPRTEGFHIVLLQKKKVFSPWGDPELYARMQLVAAKASRIIMKQELADWVNIHYDGNTGAAKGNPVLHIHIFGRYKTGEKWGGPLVLPFGEESYGNKPLSEAGITVLRRHFRNL